MAIYLVDMENIPHAWAKLLDACTESDRFVLFYTEQVHQVPITLMERVTRSPVAMDYVRCRSGMNGLDFQLVTEMGYRVAKDPDAEYIIVSQDHGFDVVVDYWSERGIRTKRIVPAVSERGDAVLEHGGEFDFTNSRSVRDFLGWRLSNKVRKAEIPGIVNILMDAMARGYEYPEDKRLSYRFTYLDRALRRKYGDTKGPKLRDQIKAVSHEAFSMNLRAEPEDVSEDLPEIAPEEAASGMEAERKLPEPKPEPEPAAEERPEEEAAVEALPVEEPADIVYARLAGLGLTASRAREVAEIVSEVLRSGEEHQRAVIYRRIVSTFGRKDGVELYRAAKDSVGQLIQERDFQLPGT